MLPHFVKDDDLAKAGARAKQGGERVYGDPDKAFQEAEAVSEGQYGIPVVYHSLPGAARPGHPVEARHGARRQGDQIMVWPSTQNVPAYAGDLGNRLKVPATNIKVQMDYIGGGFGSKFNPDAWAIVGAELSKKAGGRPVQLFLDRADRADDRAATGRRRTRRSRSAARRTARSPPSTRSPGAPAASPP